MKAHEAEKLIETIKGFIDNPSPASERKGATPAPAGKATEKYPMPEERVTMGGVDVLDVEGRKVKLSRDVLEAIYRGFKNRLIDELRVDPVFLQLLSVAPEMEVTIEPRVVKLDAQDTLRGRVARLLADGFASGTTRATGSFRQQLKKTGADPGGGGALSDVLSGFVRDGFLVREGEGYRLADNVKITTKRLEV